MSLSFEDLLAALAPKVEAVKVKGLGAFHIREMSVRQRADFSKRVFGEGVEVTPQSYVFDLLATTLCQEDGSPLMSLEQAEGLWGASEAKLAPLVKHAERVNGFGKAAVADAEKNSEPTQSDASSST